jgi:hemerythrin-like domain-containing protein
VHFWSQGGFVVEGESQRRDGDEQIGIELLKRQHREVLQIFAALNRQGPDQDIFNQLLSQMAVHMEIEERVFYPSLVDGGIEENTMRKSAEEHLSAKRILADLIDLPLDHETWMAKSRVLQEQFEHHVSEEENEIFPWAFDNLDEDYLLALGQEMASSSHGMLEDEDELQERVITGTEEATPIEPLH